MSQSHKKQSLVFSSEGSFIYRLLRVQYVLMSCSYAYTFVLTRAILPCLFIRQSTCLWTMLVHGRAIIPCLSIRQYLYLWTVLVCASVLIPCEIGVYPYLPIALYRSNPKSVPNIPVVFLCTVLSSRWGFHLTIILLNTFSQY